MNRIAIVSGISTLLFASIAFAATWSGDVLLSAVEKSAPSTTGDADTYLIFASTPTGKPGCATSAQGLIYTTDEGEIAMTAVATAALLSGRPVRVYWDASCSGNYGRIIGVQLK